MLNFLFNTVIAAILGMLAGMGVGGGSLLLNTIESNFAVDVDRYVAFDFYSFVDCNHVYGASAPD